MSLARAGRQAQRREESPPCGAHERGDHYAQREHAKARSGVAHIAPGVDGELLGFSPQPLTRRFDHLLVHGASSSDREFK